MLLGVDCGTSALKALVLSPEGRQVAGPERVPLEVKSPHPGWAEADPDDWWTALATACRRLREQNPAAMDAVQAVGISTIFPALVVMDVDGRPLHPAILYCDLRSTEQVEHISRHFGREPFETITGNRLTSGTCMTPGILWLRRHVPDVFRRAAIFGSAATYLVCRLTGNVVMDFSNASFSGLVEAGREHTYHPDLLDVAGVAPERLPRLVPSIEPVGRILPAAAEECGLPAGAVVAAGGGDAPMAAVGAGVIAPRRLFVCTGSTDCPVVTIDRPPRNPVFANCRFPIPELWTSIAATSTAGAAVKWCCEKVFHCTPDELTQWAGTAPPGSRGVVFLPYLQGERTPWWDPYARGVFFGLGIDAGRNEMARAVLEGVAHAWRQIIADLETDYGIHADDVTVVGGSTGNALWNRIRASVVGRPLRILRFAESASLGAAMTAGMAAGIFRDAFEACRATEPLRDSYVVEPVPEWSDPCRAGAILYDRLYPALKPLFRERGAFDAARETSSEPAGEPQ